MITSEKAREYGKNSRQKTPKEREEFVQFFIDKICSGYGSRKAIDAFQEKFNIRSTDTAWRYLKKAKERIQEIGNENIAEAKAVMRERLLDIYEKTHESKNYKTALQSLKQLSELDGLDAPQKTELNIDTNAEFNFD